MRKKAIIYIITTLLISSGGLLKAQDAHFSQFYANPMYLNPAFAGTAVCPRLIMNYRNQWPAISGAFVTYNAGFDMHFDAISGGLGVLVTSDRAGEGVLTTNTASLIYSYKLQVTRFFAIKAGFQGSFFQKSLDGSKLTFGNQIDARWGFVYDQNPKIPTLSSSGVDFSAGMLGFSEKFYIGFAVHHLTQPDEGLQTTSLLPMKLTFHTGGIIPLTRGKRRRRPEDPVLSPNVAFFMQGPYHQMNYGLYVNKLPIIAGLWYRQFFEGSDALIVLLGFQYDKFKFGYTYDITVSKLASASGGAHEISFAMMFNCPIKKRHVREISCPSF